MNRRYTKKEFQELSFETKCFIIENILSHDYYDGQAEINFYIPPDFKGEIGEDLPETPSEIKEVEDLKFDSLICKLTDKLFEDTNEIEFDLEKNEGV